MPPLALSRNHGASEVFAAERKAVTPSSNFLQVVHAGLGRGVQPRRRAAAGAPREIIAAKGLLFDLSRIMSTSLYRAMMSPMAIRPPAATFHAGLSDCSANKMVTTPAPLASSDTAMTGLGRPEKLVSGLCMT